VPCACSIRHPHTVNLEVAVPSVAEEEAEEEEEEEELVVVGGAVMLA
jgi:hypothetical protein